MQCHESLIGEWFNHCREACDGKINSKCLIQKNVFSCSQD